MRTRPSRSQLAEWLGCPARSCEGARMPWRPPAKWLVALPAACLRTLVYRRAPRAA
jgi:hypothetical protein